MINLLRRLKPQAPTKGWEDYFHGREELLWEGHPATGFKGTWGMVFMSLFGLPFFGAGVLALTTGLASIFSGTLSDFAMGLFVVLFSVPFLLVGLGLVFGTWIAMYYAPHFIRYAVTNKRAYIATSWWNHRIESYPIREDTFFELDQGRFDTVYFHLKISRDSDGDRTETKIGFEHIENGMEVYQLLRDVQAKEIEKRRDQ